MKGLSLKILIFANKCTFCSLYLISKTFHYSHLITLSISVFEIRNMKVIWRLFIWYTTTPVSWKFEVLALITQPNSILGKRNSIYGMCTLRLVNWYAKPYLLYKTTYFFFLLNDQPHRIFKGKTINNIWIVRVMDFHLICYNYRIFTNNDPALFFMM